MKARLLAVGLVGASGVVLGVLGVGAAQADPMPPAGVAVQFGGTGSGASQTAAESAATAQAMANEAAFEKAFGATCVNAPAKTQSFKAGDMYVANAEIDAMCTVPAPSASTPPSSVTVKTQFGGMGSAAKAADAESAATAQAMANEAAFEKASGATCANTATKTQSFKAGDMYVANTEIDASCVVAVPAPPSGS